MFYISRHSTTVRVSVSSAIVLGAVIAQLWSPSSILRAQTIPANSTVAPSPSIEPFSIPSTEISLTAIPPRVGDDFSLKAKPGETLQISVRVRNSSSSPVSIKSYAEDFILEDDGKTPIPVTQQVPSRWSLASWLTVSPAAQTIPANSAGQINIVITVPNDALPGGHYAMVLSQPADPSQASGITQTGKSEAAIGQRLGSLVYLTVDGPINEEALIRELRFPKFTEYGPVPFTLKVENLSDIHIQPRLSVEIFNLFGQKVDSIELESKNVFPFIARDFDGQWNRVWGIGYYKARAVMSYGSQGQVAVANTTFWLLPIKLVIAGAISILTFITFTLAIRKHLMHRSKYDRKRIKELEDRLSELEK